MVDSSTAAAYEQLRTSRDSARAPLVNRARHQFLTGSAFPAYQHRCRALRHTRDRLERVQHPRTLAHDRFRRLRGRRRLRTTKPRSHLVAAHDQLAKLPGFGREREDIARAAIHCVQRHTERGRARNQRDRLTRCSQALDQLERRIASEFGINEDNGPTGLLSTNHPL